MKATSKTLIEQELRDSEQRYRLLADNISDVIWTIDLNGNFTYVSPSVERLRGYTPEEVMQQPITDALTPDSLKIALEGLERLRNAEDSGDLSDIDNRFELEQPCKDGSTVWTEVITNVLQDDQNNIIGVLSVARDITERKRAQISLQQAHDELAVRVSELTMLNHIAETVATATDLQTALEALAEQLVILFDLKACATTLLDSDRTGLRVLAQYQRNRMLPSLVGTFFTLADHPADRTVVETGRFLMVTQETPDLVGGATYERMQNRNIQCMLIVPLLVRGKVIGTISMSTDQIGREFTPTEVELASTIAGQVAGTIENARLFEEEQRQRKMAESLREVAMVLNSSLDLETVLAKILEQMRRVIQHDGTAIFLSDEEALILTAGAAIDETFVGNRIPISGQSPEARVYRQKRALVIADVHDDSNWISWLNPEPIHSWMGAPLFVGEKVIGIITADNFEIAEEEV